MKGEEMKYLVIFAIMSVAGTFGIATTTSTDTNYPKTIPVEYIEFDTPLIIKPSV